ncbi:MAG: isoprenylcysteine carboxylmethyltransferase family protein, partial [Planctomycetaceae bacterium]|nr:isoprenylcysteine carboxylmethyltransferase family protein [Planctomycetaceae bacterium]
LMGLLLFGSAGTLRWPAGWVYLAESHLGGLAIGLWLARYSPGLLAERLRPPVQRAQKKWDKILVSFMLALWFGWLALMAADAARFRISLVPTLLQVLGALAVAISMYLVFLVFRANPFAASVVKIQEERGHSVITTGPYRLVRHPMYAGIIPYLLGVPLLLGSWLGLALVPFLIVVLGIRTVLEERTLRTELENYDAYAADVRYRLVPHIW